MKAKILSYVDFEKVNILLEGFNQVTGFVTAILDIDGDVLSKSGWRSICTDFHRVNAQTAINCKTSDTVLANQMAAGETYHFYKCINGLIDVAVPIVIKGEHIANLFSGQFFFEKPDFEYFRKQAQRFGFDEEAYLDALRKVPVVDGNKVEDVMKFLIDIIQMISELTQEKLEQAELLDAIKRGETELFSTEKKLELSMRDLLESQRIAHLGTWRLDVATNEVVWSDELYKMYGFDPTLPPPPFSEHEKLFTADSWNLLSSALERTRTEGIPYELELETVNINGKNGWMWVRGEALRDEKGIITTLWGAAQEISPRKNTEKELFYFAFHDHLTGLYNRRYFEQELKKIDVEENLPISIIMCDLNGLKLINDSFGHEYGDRLLIKAAESIMHSCPTDAIAARVGGDEFAIALKKTPATVAKHIVENMRSYAAYDKTANIQLSISCGYDAKLNVTQSVMSILINAENLMYKHKLSDRSLMRSQLIHVIMNTLFEKRDAEMLHAGNVSRLCTSIATNMNQDKSFVEKIRVLGLVHDIGKISIDDKILNKNGVVNSEERKVIEGHSEAGWRILSSTNEFSDLAEYVRDHHEKWDGSGYPTGLIGDKIPVESRILSVADAFDSMTGERTYRRKLSIEEAVDELYRCSGTHFDASIVDIFVQKVVPLIHEDKNAFLSGKYLNYQVDDWFSYKRHY